MAKAGRLTKKEADQKKRQGKRMYVNGFELTEIAEILEVHDETIKRWYKQGNWQDEKDMHSLSIAELKRQTLQTFADMKEGKTPKLSPDQLSKLASTFEKLSDKRKALAYMFENFEVLTDAILKDAMSERKPKEKLRKIEISKYVRRLMEDITSNTYKEALND